MIQLHKGLTFIFLLSVLIAPPPAKADDFSFDQVKSLSEMRDLILARFKLGYPQEDLRKFFLDQGKATLKKHPDKPRVEKYIYDINLCRVYVWQWNISADYDTDDKLLQAYVNGEPVFDKGTPKVDKNSFHPPSGTKAVIVRMQRPRPEADRGEKSLASIVLDADGDLSTIDDQVLIGAGPTKPDPKNLGTLHVYKEIEPWRSIFSMDNADTMVPYSGGC